MADQAITAGEVHRAKSADLFLSKHSKEGPGSPESKLIFVYRRAKKDSELPHKTVKLFDSLGMWRPYSGVFVKADETMLIILQKLGPVVRYGYPPRHTVKDILIRSGAVKVNNEPKFLREDNVVEQAFGCYNIFCMEDVVNEIVNVGSHFKDVTDALRPFAVRNKKFDDIVNLLADKMKNASRVD